MCAHCYSLFKTQQELDEHAKRHKTASGESQDMWIHQPTQNSTDPYQCVKCLKWFKTPETVKTHYQAIHVDGKVECDVCGKVLANVSSLKSHMKLQHPTGQTCMVCFSSRKLISNTTKIFMTAQYLYSELPWSTITNTGTLVLRNKGNA